MNAPKGKMVTGVNQDQLFNALLQVCEEHGADIPGWKVTADVRCTLSEVIDQMIEANGFAGEIWCVKVWGSDAGGWTTVADRFDTEEGAASFLRMLAASREDGDLGLRVSQS